MTISLRLDGEEFPIALVRLSPDDTQATAFVFNAWLESYRGADEPRKMGNDAYFRNHHRLVSSLMERSLTRLVVSDEDRRLFLGFACAEPLTRVVHYVFVKKGWREAGAARALLDSFGWPEDSEIEISHHTYFVDKLRDRSAEAKRRLRYNPYRRSAA